MLKKIKTSFTFMLTLVLIFSLFSGLKITSFAGQTIGDVNSDGQVNAADARIVLRASAKLENLSDKKFSLADINGDGKVNASDARIILRIAAKLDSVDNYLNDNNTSPTIEISGYFGKPVEEVLAVFPDLKLFEDYDDLYFNDYMKIFVADDGTVSYIDVCDNESDYTLFGISVGDNINYASEKLREQFPEGYFVSSAVFVFGDRQVNLMDYDGELFIISLEKSTFDPTDLSWLLNANVEDAKKVYPQIKNNEEDSVDDYYIEYECDDFAFAANKNGTITDVILISENYNIFGVSIGDWYRSSVNSLKEYGFEFDDEFGYLDDYVLYITKNLRLKVEYIMLSYSPSNEEIFFDLRWFTYVDIDLFMDNIGELEKSNTVEGMYTNDFLEVYIAGKDFIVKIKMIDDSELYNICGVKVGMSYDEAKEKIEMDDFEFRSPTYACNEFGECIELEITPYNTVSSVAVYDYDNIFEYQENDLMKYLSADFYKLEEVIPSLTQSEDLEEIYRNDFAEVVLDFGCIDEIHLYSDSEFNLGGVCIGDSYEAAKTTLKENGYIFLTSDSAFNSNGEIVMMNIDENGVIIGLSCIVEYFDLNDLTIWLDEKIEFAADVYPDLTVSEDGFTYSNDSFSLTVDECDRVTEITIFGETEKCIFGIEYGMDFEDFTYYIEYDHKQDEYTYILGDYKITVDVDENNCINKIHFMYSDIFIEPEDDDTLWDWLPDIGIEDFWNNILGIR